LATARIPEGPLILHLITDRRRLAGEGADWDGARRCLLDQVSHAIEAGIDVLQIRERDLEAADLARLVSEIVNLARGTRCRVVVNDRLDVALACAAAGVHLRADSISPSAARAIVPRGFLIGRSVHAPEEAGAVAADVDYLIAGTVWPTESKAAGRDGTAPIGPEGLAAIARAAGVPVLAVGGVTLDRVSRAAASGAAGVAAIGLFMGPPPEPGWAGCRAIALEDTVRRVRARFDTPEQAS